MSLCVTSLGCYGHGCEVTRLLACETRNAEELGGSSIPRRKALANYRSPLIKSHFSPLSFLPEAASSVAGHTGTAGLPPNFQNPFHFLEVPKNKSTSNAAYTYEYHICARIYSSESVQPSKISSVIRLWFQHKAATRPGPRLGSMLTRTAFKNLCYIRE